MIYTRNAELPYSSVDPTALQFSIPSCRLAGWLAPKIGCDFMLMREKKDRCLAMVCKACDCTGYDATSDSTRTQCTAFRRTWQMAIAMAMAMIAGRGPAGDFLGPLVHARSAAERYYGATSGRFDLSTGLLAAFATWWSLRPRTRRPAPRRRQSPPRPPPSCPPPTRRRRPIASQARWRTGT